LYVSKKICFDCLLLDGWLTLYRYLISLYLNHPCVYAEIAYLNWYQNGVNSHIIYIPYRKRNIFKHINNRRDNAVERRTRTHLEHLEKR
jgi:hypothetical protein